jgi:hypothetical protein
MFDFEQNPRFQTKQQTEQGITKAIKTSTTQRILLHLCLVGAIDHATGPGNGDTTLLSRLYNGLGNETNKAKGIATWIKTFTNLKYKTAKDGSEQWLKPKGEALHVFVGYDSTPFYDMPKVEADNKPWDFDALLQKLLKGASDRYEKKQLSADQLEEALAITAARDEFLKRKTANNPVDTEIPFLPAQVAA